MRKTVYFVAVTLLASFVMTPMQSMAQYSPPDFAALAKKLKPAVVNIGTEKKVKQRRQHHAVYGQPDNERMAGRARADKAPRSNHPAFPEASSSPHRVIAAAQRHAGHRVSSCGDGEVSMRPDTRRR
jgi:S1-C subfamily serine protease